MPRTPKVRAPALPPTNRLSPPLQVLQATAMVARATLGKTIKDIAAEFEVTPATVRRRLQLARETGVLQQAQVIILEKLVPLAVATYAHALQDESGDPELRLKAAKDVLFGAGALESKSSSTTVHQMDRNTLEAFRAEREGREPVIVDAEVEGEMKQLPGVNDAT